MSIATARAAAYSLLSTCGVWLTSEISACDYRIIESVAASGIVFHPDGDSLIEPLTFAFPGGNAGAQSITWGFRGNGFLRYDGNDPSFIGKMYQFMDDIEQTFAKSWRGTGSDTASLLRLTRINCNLDEGYDLGGVEYGLIRFWFQEEEIDTPQ